MHLGFCARAPHLMTRTRFTSHSHSFHWFHSESFALVSLRVTRHHCEPLRNITAKRVSLRKESLALPEETNKWKASLEVSSADTIELFDGFQGPFLHHSRALLRIDRHEYGALLRSFADCRALLQMYKRVTLQEKLIHNTGKVCQRPLALAIGTTKSRLTGQEASLVLRQTRFFQSCYKWCLWGGDQRVSTCLCRVGVRMCGKVKAGP